jgi:hypothetical protein
MNEQLFTSTTLDQAVAALKKDLLADSGPQISTMRNYRFAILPYRPAEEFKLRRKIKELTEDLMAAGWNVLSISLQKLLLDRIRAVGDDFIESLIQREQRLYQKDPERALFHLRDRVAPHIEGPDGLAADVARLIDDLADAHPDKADRTLALIGRCGALYPFFRSSALLKHIDGRTRNIPVVLLYPGERQSTTALSYMGILPADRDYRPRIYP